MQFLSFQKPPLDATRLTTREKREREVGGMEEGKMARKGKRGQEEESWTYL